MNETESAFAAWLDAEKVAGRITRWVWSRIRLECGPRTWLLIDVAVTVPIPGTDYDRIVFVDVKGGPWEDDAAVKTKTVAAQFAWLGEVWVVRRKRAKDGGGWQWRRVSPTAGLCGPGDPPW